MQNWPNQPPHGQATPKKGLSTVMVVLAVVGFAIIACGGLVCVGGYFAAQKGAEAQAEKDREAAAKLPFMATFDANCKAYRAATSPADKARIAKEQQAFVSRSTIAVTTGTLKDKRPSADKTELDFTIAVGSAEFSTGLLGAVEQDTRPYLTVDKIPEGGCIRFSARSLTIASLLESSRACDKDFVADFATLEPCP